MGWRTGDDDALVDALRAGDEQAFSWLLDRYSAPLRRLARSYVASDAVADEVVQETWLGVIRGLDRFEGRSSLKTWIYQILLNTARRRGAREHRTLPFSSIGPDDADGWSGTFPASRFRSSDDEWAGWWASPPAPWSPFERVEHDETLERVRDAVAELPHSQRVVFALRDIDGWSADEVCTALDITPGNQRVLLHRARARVRATLDPYLAESGAS